MGPWTPDAGKALRYRARLGREDLALLYNVSAEFAWSLDRRSLADRARSAVFSSVPDAVLVSGQITGEAAELSDLEAVKAALPGTPVLANTGVKHATVADVLRRRGRLHRRLVAEGGRRHLEAGGPGARAGFHGARPQGAGRMSSVDRIGGWLRDLMLVPGLSGHEDRVRRHIAGILAGMGIESRSDPLGNLLATIEGRLDGPSVMLIAHMDQLGFVVRRLLPEGLVQVERLGGVPERALAAQDVLICLGEGRDLAGVILNKSHHATGPEEKYRVLPWREIVIDAGFSSADEARAAGVRVGVPVIYRPHVADLAGGRLAGTAVDDRAGCAVLLEVARALAGGRGGPDGAPRLLGAGRIQPARRAAGGAAACAAGRDPARSGAGRATRRTWRASATCGSGRGRR